MEQPERGGPARHGVQGDVNDGGRGVEGAHRSPGDDRGGGARPQEAILEPEETRQRHVPVKLHRESRVAPGRREGEVEVVGTVQVAGQRFGDPGVRVAARPGARGHELKRLDADRIELYCRP